MHAVYGNLCISKKTVVEWHHMFNAGWQGTSLKAKPSQALIIAIPENIRKLDKAVYAYRSVIMLIPGV
jgi:hypothetical protein